MRTQPLTVAGLAGPLVIIRSELSGRYSITVGGRPVPASGKREYQLPTTGGRTVPARILRPKVLDPFPTIEVGGQPYRTGPKVPPALMVLVFVPLVLVGLGGLVGGLFGAIGVVANLAIARSSQPTAVQVPLMLGTLILTGVAWLIVAGTIVGLTNG